MRPGISVLVPLLHAIDRLNVLVGSVVAVLVPAMIVVICCEVVARYVFNSPTIWAHDLSVFMFGYLGLLSGGYIHKLQRHISVDILYIRASIRSKVLLDVVNGSLGIFFLVLVGIVGWHKAMEDIAIGARLSTEWAPSRGHLMLMIPIGAGLLIFQSFANCIRSIYFAWTGRRLA